MDLNAVRNNSDECIDLVSVTIFKIQNVDTVSFVIRLHTRDMG